MLQKIKIGDIIGPNFKIVDIYGGEGKSGMGVVYVCLNLDYEYIFALKTFQDRFISSNEMIECFKQEALVWIHLEKHPNVINAITFDIIDERPFIYLELVLPDHKNRKTLEDYLKYDLSSPQILDWAIQFCWGMEHATVRGVCPHRDIKPANIMIKEKILKITDFGLSKLSDNQNIFKTPENLHKNINYSENHSEGVILSGTRSYMAPENFSGHADIKSDIYSFGIVLFQMTAKGCLPFFAEDDHGWKKVHQNSEVPVLDSKIFPIIKKCLNKCPNNRYSNFTELRNDLERLYVNESGKIPYIPIKQDLKAEELSNKGYGFEKLGFNDNAIQEYKEASEMDPNSFLVRMNLGRSLMRIDRSEDAIEELEIAVKLNPNSARAHYNLGNAFYNSKLIDEAIFEYKIALKIDDCYKEVYNNYGNLIRGEGKIDESISCYNKALNIDPDFFEAKVNLGVAQLFKCRYDEAISLFEDAEKINSESPDLYYYWGSTLSIQGQDDTAFFKFIKVITIDSEYSDAHLSLAIHFENKGQIDNAIKEFKKVTELNSLDTIAIHKLGVLYSHNEKYDDADYWFNKLIEIDPKNSKPWYGKGINFNKSGNLEEAIKCFDKAIEINPNDEFSWLNKGSFLGEIGNPQEAIKCFDKAIEINPNCAEALCHKGTALGETNKYFEAIECFNSSLKIKSNPETWFQKGLLMGKHEKNEEALKCFNNVLEINPQFAIAYFFKGILLNLLGNHEEGEINLAKAIEIDPNILDPLNQNEINC
jgi:tetratricopeptide (TPR) repeat protein